MAGIIGAEVLGSEKAGEDAFASFVLPMLALESSESD